jgi:uracil-DNA glycosylase family 4
VKKFHSLEVLDKAIIKCDRCPRLVDWREEVAVTKRKSYQDQRYWGKPVPGFGVAKPKILIVGLAPGAHGANRTGRIFTGDSSGDWLYRSLYKSGLAKIPTSKSKDDGQELIDTRITCAVHCVPPENKPTIEERDNCSSWFTAEFELAYPSVRSIVALGAFGWDAVIRILKNHFEVDQKAPKFAHGAEFKWSDDRGNSRLLIGSYHPSQQNTFTGKLTEAMLDRVFARASRFAA